VIKTNKGSQNQKILPLAVQKHSHFTLLVDANFGATCWEPSTPPSDSAASATTGFAATKQQNKSEKSHRAAIIRTFLLLGML
jgi:hypothetical protein